MLFRSKGQSARAGYWTPAVFEGGQMPLVRRVPKRGFHNRWALTVATVNVGELDKRFANGEASASAALANATTPFGETRRPGKNFNVLGSWVSSV